MDTALRHFSPAWGWAVAGAVSFPALTFALGYLPTTPLIARQPRACLASEYTESAVRAKVFGSGAPGAAGARRRVAEIQSMR